MHIYEVSISFRHLYTSMSKYVRRTEIVGYSFLLLNPHARRKVINTKYNTFNDGHVPHVTSSTNYPHNSRRMMSCDLYNFPK